MSSTTVYYLQRHELYRVEKPYIFTFNPPSGAVSKTNHSYVPLTVTVRDARPRMSSFSLDIHGFQFQQWTTALSSGDFDDDQKVREEYYPEILDHMRRQFPDSLEIHVLTHLRRKRDPSFLQVAEEEPRFQNPIVYAHTDFTPRGSAAAIEPVLEAHQHLRGTAYEMIKYVTPFVHPRHVSTCLSPSPFYFQRKRCQLQPRSAWRPTRGPNRDWPLGLCDYQTTEPEDVEFSDVIHPDHVGESLRLYPNSKHGWYFLDHQTTDEVALFRNSHSAGLAIPFGAHLSFPNPNQAAADDEAPRESIEVRMVRFF